MSTQNPQQPPVFPGAAAPVPPAKPKKPWFKRLWVWAIALIVVVAVASQLGGGRGNQATQTTAGAPASGAAAPAAPAPAKPEPKAKLTLDDGWKMDKSDGIFVYVTGYVTNNTDKAITNYVQITFDALDKSGANLGTCLANTNTVDAGGKWKFKAMCTGEAKEIDTVRFKEITGF